MYKDCLREYERFLRHDDLKLDTKKKLISNIQWIYETTSCYDRINPKLILLLVQSYEKTIHELKKDIAEARNLPYIKDDIIPSSFAKDIADIESPFDSRDYNNPIYLLELIPSKYHETLYELSCDIVCMKKMFSFQRDWSTFLNKRNPTTISSAEEMFVGFFQLKMNLTVIAHCWKSNPAIKNAHNTTLSMQCHNCDDCEYGSYYKYLSLLNTIAQSSIFFWIYSPDY